MMLCFSNSYAGNWEKKIQDALSPDTPDSTRIEVLLYIAVEQDRDLSIAEARIEQYEKLYEIEKRPWYDTIMDSTIAKVVLFVGGVYLGREMVEVR
jgi:hypothetical protein